MKNGDGAMKGEEPPHRLVAKLNRSSKQRRLTGKTVIDGFHLLQVYLEEIGNPEAILIKESSTKGQEAQSALNGLPDSIVFELPDGDYNALSPVKTPSGVLAVAKIPKILAPEAWQSCTILEDVQDPGNLGAILRSAAAAGVQVAYLSKKCADPWSPKSLRAGMGAQFYLEINEANNLAETVASFEGKVLAAGPAESQSVFETDLTGRVAFIVGNEGAGLSTDLKNKASSVVSIPMPGRGESLNAAAAASILFFEKVRQDGIESLSGRDEEKELLHRNRKDR